MEALPPTIAGSALDVPVEQELDTATSALVAVPAIFIQDACYEHRFIRSRDTSAIVERPERLRAVKLGLAAAIARLEEFTPKVPAEKAEPTPPASQAAGAGEEDLAAALGRMNIAASSPAPDHHTFSSVSVVHSAASLDFLDNAAVKFVHGDIDGDVYLENLTAWARDSVQKITDGGSEIPDGMNQGDLYLCPESISAIQGALGTVCEAVDTVLSAGPIAGPGSATPSRAFVAIRPPGHHCGEDTPSGFCFVNNVAVGAAHAHLKHGVNRVVILDIDLHHGNGTQSIAWQINEETYRQTLESERPEDGHESTQGLQIYYGSIHDILSFPCEEGKADLVQAASVSLHGPHGQYIENIHLDPYTSEEHFWETLYKKQYSRLILKAEEFLEKTGSGSDDVLVFISCGFDASEHEYPSMSRHGRKVPASFYYRFAQDACAFAERHSRGRIVSVLEGGYSDRALTAGAMAHLSGLVSDKSRPIDESWWGLDNLIKLEKAAKKRAPRRSNASAASPETWLDRALSIMSMLDANAAQRQAASSLPVPPPSTSMTLRERKKPTTNSAESSPKIDKREPTSSRGARKHVKKETATTSKPQEAKSDHEPHGMASADDASSNATESSVEADADGGSTKRLPRVILRLGPRPPGA